MNDTPHRELSVLVQNIDGTPDPALHQLKLKCCALPLEDTM